MQFDIYARPWLYLTLQARRALPSHLRCFAASPLTLARLHTHTHTHAHTHAHTRTHHTHTQAHARAPRRLRSCLPISSSPDGRCPRQIADPAHDLTLSLTTLTDSYVLALVAVNHVPSFANYTWMLGAGAPCSANCPALGRTRCCHPGPRRGREKKQGCVTMTD